MPVTNPTQPVYFTTPLLPVARVFHQIRATATDRTLLQRQLGYSQASITRHVGALINAGLVEEVRSSVDDGTKAGRPRTGLSIDGRHLTAWGAHIGVNSTEIVVSDLAGRVIRHETLDIHVPGSTSSEILGTVSDALTQLGAGLPEPVNVGVAFSAHVDRDGLITSDSYGWENADVGADLSAVLGRPVSIGTGVAAMAGTEIIESPLQASEQPAPSTLYFYAREVIAHAWIFNGAVHRPHTGRSPAAFHPENSTGSHPLSTTKTLQKAHEQGIRARSLAELVHLGSTRPVARKILDDRATALGDAVASAIDVVDPDTVVFAGDAFTTDPAGLRIVVERLRSRSSVGGQLRIQRADQHILRTAAIQVALHAVRQDPLSHV
ncbi:ROK family protein [Corynebacterium pacaense]|uniref:ROK family protein n=1 Tax=Corynebacterium pacaense TaxID=1816684 RepID=UPI0009BBF877|nr:ROK family protein [Corynebacterium pacaense]